MRVCVTGHWILCNQLSQMVLQISQERVHGEMQYKPHVFQVGENEGLLLIKTTGNDVLGILVCQAVSILYRHILPEKLLVIRHLDNQWHIKYILEVPGEIQAAESNHSSHSSCVCVCVKGVLCEEEGYEVAEVHGL